MTSPALRTAPRTADALVRGLLAVADLARRLVGHRLSAVLGRGWATITARLGLRADVVTRPSTVGMRRLAAAGIAVNAFIVVSGGLVRVTKSGLGCPTWPRCTPESLLPAAHADIAMTQTIIEFGNRMLTFVLFLVAVVVFIAAAALRDRRPDLARLAVVQPIGVPAQAVLGGATVLSGLHPLLVGAHYLLSALVLVACVALFVRAGEGDLPPRPTVSPAAYRLALALPFLAFGVLAAGTVVTGAGPHAGDDTAPRYDFLGAGTVAATARVHSVLVWVTLAVVLALLVLARRDGNRRLTARLWVLVAVIAAQGGLGYLQYALGVPAWLVLLHVAGSVAFWVAVLFVRFGIRDRGDLAHGDGAPGTAHSGTVHPSAGDHSALPLASARRWDATMAAAPGIPRKPGNGFTSMTRRPSDPSTTSTP